MRSLFKPSNFVPLGKQVEKSRFNFQKLSITLVCRSTSLMRLVLVCPAALKAERQIGNNHSPKSLNEMLILKDIPLRTNEIQIAF